MIGKIAAVQNTLYAVFLADRPGTRHFLFCDRNVQIFTEKRQRNKNLKC